MNREILNQGIDELYWIILLIVFCLFLFVRKRSLKEFLTKKYNRKAISIITKAPNMNMNEIKEAHNFLCNENIARKIEFSLWDDAISAINIRKEILLDKEKEI